MEKDYAEQILQAVEIVVDKCLNSVSYDKTENCTIISNTDKKNGKYIVSNGAINFEAFVNTSSGANIPEYRINDSVRVSIPNGDYTQKKYIEGLSITDNDTLPITYVSPLETLLDISKNILPNDNSNYGLIANNSETNQILIWSADLSTDSRYQNSNIYNAIGLRGDFKTALSQYNINNGSYGLRLDMWVKPSKDSSEADILYSAYLDSADMFGNPYSFLVSSTQAIKFDISNIGIIQKMQLYFYQKNNFTYLDDNNVTHRLPKYEYNNLLVKNIYLSFGSDLDKIEDNTLKIHTKDSLHFNADSESNYDNIKNLELLWHNKDENGKYIGFSDGYFDKDYDEIEYLELTAADTRLIAQKSPDIPNDKNSLMLMADLTDANSIINQLKVLIGKDLNQTLISYRQRLDEIPAHENEVGESFNTIINTTLPQTVRNIEDKFNKLNEYYKEVLSQVKVEEGKDYEVPSIDDSKKILPEQVLEDIANLLSSTNSLLLLVTQTVDNSYSGYKDVCDSFNSKVSKLVEKINATKDQYNTLMAYTEEKNINKYFDKNWKLVLYISPINSDNYSNKYCIYWYRYTPNVLNNSKYVFLGKEWTKMDYDNFGLPNTSIIKDDGLAYNNEQALNGENILTLTLPNEYPVERYQAVLFYNHEMIKSDIVEFINDNPPIDKNIIDLYGALYLEHKENSQNSYQLYGANNCLVNAADAQRKRYLQVRYDGENGKDELLIGAQVFWYIPKNSTMLTYSSQDYVNSFAINETSKGNMTIDGYVCFYRVINKLEDCRFSYRIKNYYSPTFSNNNIICKIILSNNSSVFETEELFTFSSFGTSGTDYTLVAAPAGSKSYADSNYDNKPDSSIEEENVNLWLKINLYDYNNKPLSLDNQTLTVNWIGPHKYLNTTQYYRVDNSWYYPIKFNEDQSGYGPGIISFSTNFNIGDRTVDLTTFYTVAWSAQDAYIEGASSVIYDSAGAYPVYYKNPYKIFNDKTDLEINDVSWEIVYYGENSAETPLTNSELNSKEYILLKNYMPTLGNKQELIPCNMYLDANLYPVVLCKNKNGITIWAQPIHLMQNRYPSAMLNAWDGSLKIDEENGTILSSMIGAGRKTANNTFEGILLGNVGGQVGTDNATGIGLYGYNDGAQSFYFGIDGTAFLGKSGRGRIHFNGNNASISSASYQQTKDAGMMIDLDDGFIDIRGATKNASGFYSKDTQSRIHLDAKSPYFYINSETGKTIINIGKDSYYLQSNNYASNAGMKINLLTGHIDAYNFKLTSSRFVLDSHPTGTNPYFRIKDANEKELINVAANSYYLQSSNFKNAISGMKIDLANGSIEMRKGNDGAILINSSATTYPLQIGTANGNVYPFQVGWDGSLKSGALNIDSSGNLWINGLEFKDAPFGVDNKGAIYSSSGIIAGFKITQTSIETENQDQTDPHPGTATLNPVIYLGITPINVSNETGSGRLLYEDILFKVGTKFRVSSNGYVAADGIYINGGMIGPLDVGQYCIGSNPNKDNLNGLGFDIDYGINIWTTPTSIPKPSRPDQTTYEFYKAGHLRIGAEGEISIKGASILFNNRFINNSLNTITDQNIDINLFLSALSSENKQQIKIQNLQDCLHLNNFQVIEEEQIQNEFIRKYYYRLIEIIHQKDSESQLESFYGYTGNILLSENKYLHVINGLIVGYGQKIESLDAPWKTERFSVSPISEY